MDNLGVVCHVGRLMDGRRGPIPFELLKDGDLLLLINRMLRLRGPDTVRISKVTGHADETMVLNGQVREVDRLGNNAADDAADFGRRRVGNAVIDARRNLSGVCNRWYPVLLDLHRFFIAISLEVWSIMMVVLVLLLILLVWSAGAHPKRRRLVHAVRDRAFLPGPPGLWDSDWVNIPASAISAADIDTLALCTPGLLVKWVSFLASLHWPAGGSDLGVCGISYLELLILYELWAGERLSLEKATPRYLRPGRPISVSAVPFGPGIDIWRSCRFIGALMRALCLLPGGLGRFVPCSIGANHCRLRHIGWERCGHGLTSRPRASRSTGSVDLGHFGISFLELLILFEQWAGHRLLCEKVTRPHVRANRPILIPSVPVSEGIEIRHGCQFLSSLVRALAKLPGGLGRFVPCHLGSHMARLRHIGWSQCSHGLSSRPFECGVLGYPKGSALELVDGTLKLRHCTEVFTMRFPPWSLPRVGNGDG